MKFEFCAHSARLLRKLDHVFLCLLDCESAVLTKVKKISMTSLVLPLHFAPSQASSSQNSNQGRKWLPKTGWASSNAARRRYPVALSVLPKTGWAIAHPAHPPLTPLQMLTTSRWIVTILLKSLGL